MTTKHEIICDNCDRAQTSGEEYCLSLVNRNIPKKRGDVISAVFVYPPLDKDLDFCGMGCLKQYIEKEGL